MRQIVKDNKLTHELIMELYETQIPHSFIYTFENGTRVRIVDAVITMLNPNSGSEDNSKISTVRMRFIGQNSLNTFDHFMTLDVSRLEF